MREGEAPPAPCEAGAPLPKAAGMMPAAEGCWHLASPVGRAEGAHTARRGALRASAAHTSARKGGYLLASDCGQIKKEQVKKPALMFCIIQPKPEPRSRR